MLKKFIGLVFVASLLAGCAVGQKLDYSVQAPSIPTFTQGKTVSLGVQDLRPYVLSGKEKANFIGVQRGGFYNPFDVTTSSGRPLADDLLAAFTTTLERGGAKVTGSTLSGTLPADKAVEALSKSGSERALYISFSEWKSDSFADTWVLYDITAKIFDKNGKLLGENHLQGKDAVHASAAMAANDANNGITDAFEQKIKDLLSAPQIIAALQ